MADSTTIPQNLGEYASAALGKEHMQNIAATFGVNAATDLAISIQSFDAKHMLISQESATAFGHDVKVAVEGKLTAPAADRSAFVAQVSSSLGAHGPRAAQFLQTYYDASDQKDATTAMAAMQAFEKEVRVANDSAYAQHTNNRFHGVVAPEGSPDFVSTFGTSAKLNQEVYAYAAARNLEAKGKLPSFRNLEDSAAKRLSLEVGNQFNQLLDPALLSQAAQGAINNGVVGANIELTNIQNAIKTENQPMLLAARTKLAFEAEQHVLNDRSITNALSSMGISDLVSTNQTSVPKTVPVQPALDVKTPAK